MPRVVLTMALLIAGTPVAAAETAPAPVVRTAKEPMPGPKPTTSAVRKPVERKAGDAPKKFGDSPKPPLPLLEEKNLGLGCAQG
jgi:hypothetical protein